VLIHHSPNGAYLAGDAGPLLGDGMKPGFPDLIAIWEGGVAFMEVKRAFGPRGGGGGVVSDHQEDMMQLLWSMGHRVGIVRSVDDAYNLLLECNAPCVGKLQ
jgi:hypothetical protein